MLWIFASSFFFFCACREVLNSLVARGGYAEPVPVTPSYLILVLTLAALFAWTPLHTWYFQHHLSRIATELAEGHRAKVHCNTLFDTMMDAEMLAMAHAQPATGDIGIQQPWCGTLRAYIRHPQRASMEELASLDMLTHESMHIRGEINEALTECQAIQRNYRTALMLGVPPATARQNALAYYRQDYQQRGLIGGIQSAYYSTECAPGGAMDEHLADSTWNTP